MSPFDRIKSARGKYHSGKHLKYPKKARNVSPIRSPSPEAQNVPTHKVYIFGDTDEDCHEIESDAIELSEVRSRNNPRPSGSTKDPFKRDHFIEHEVTEEDSLSKLALQFGCTIGELKRANVIYSDQDFFALKKVKIPVHLHSLVLEQYIEKYGRTKIQKGHKRSNSLPDLKTTGNVFSISSTDEDFSHGNAVYDGDTLRDEESDYLLGYSSDSGRTLSNAHSLDRTQDDLDNFLAHMEKDIRSVCGKVETQKDNLDELVNSLDVKCIQPINKPLVVQKEELGTVCGITWKGMIVTICIVVVLIPILYIVYAKWLKKTQILK